MIKNQSLSKIQITCLKALETLGMTYLAKDRDSTLYAYQTYPKKNEEEAIWYSTQTCLSVDCIEKQRLAALTVLCNWTDEEPLDIIDSLMEEKVIYSSKEGE